ncbi:MAG: hypothetical protein MHM6MM_003537 [Cercozoa sp. M6MM]
MPVTLTNVLWKKEEDESLMEFAWNYQKSRQGKVGGKPMFRAAAREGVCGTRSWAAIRARWRDKLSFKFPAWCRKRRKSLSKDSPQQAERPRSSLAALNTPRKGSPASLRKKKKKRRHTEPMFRKPARKLSVAATAPDKREQSPTKKPTVDVRRQISVSSSSSQLSLSEARVGTSINSAEPKVIALEKPERVRRKAPTPKATPAQAVLPAQVQPTRVQPTQVTQVQATQVQVTQVQATQVQATQAQVTRAQATQGPTPEEQAAQLVALARELALTCRVSPQRAFLALLRHYRPQSESSLEHVRHVLLLHVATGGRLYAYDSATVPCTDLASQHASRSES